MNDKKPTTDIQTKEQSEDKTCASKERPEIAGSELDDPSPAQLLPILVGSSTSAGHGITSGDDQVQQKFHEFEVNQRRMVEKQLDMAVKHQGVEERVAKLEGAIQQVRLKMPYNGRPMGDPNGESTTSGSPSIFPTSRKPDKSTDLEGAEKIVGSTRDGTHTTVSLKPTVNDDKDALTVAALNEMRGGLAKTVKVVDRMQEREEKRDLVVENMLEEQKRMKKDQQSDHERTVRNEEDIYKLKYNFERLSSAPNARLSFSTGSPGMVDLELSESLGQPVCATTVHEARKVAFGAAGGEPVVLASKSDPGPLMHSQTNIKQKQSASMAEPTYFESTMLMEIKKLGDNQEKMLDAFKKVTSSDRCDDDSTVTNEPQEETAITRPSTSKSTPPSFP